MNGEWWSALPPLPLPHEMQQWDRQAVELGILPEILMENAAAAAFRQLNALCPRLAEKQVWLLMGSGNNGGDAACLARYLLDAGACPHVFHTRPLEHYRNETAYHLRTARTCGVPFLPVAALTETPLPHPDILVDGLLGTGFSGQLRDDARRLVSFVNELSPRPLILSLDVPSGLDATSGLPCPEAVKADMTVSFAAAKPGLMLPWARPYTGECHVGPIAMPAKVREEGPCSFRLLDGHALTLLPAMTAASYKNTYGHILVMGGRPGMCGAGHLAARGALRSGAGLVTAAMPAAGEDQVRMGWPEIMTLPLGDPGNRDWPAQLPDDLRQRLHQCRALVIGPGMGRGKDSHAFLAALLKEPERPACVFDADALMLLAGDPALLAALGPGDILTPHPGEAAALLHCPGSAVQQDRMAALKALCAAVPAAVVLKGAGTLVGQRDCPTGLSPLDVPQLAMGGSGDVLAGCTAALPGGDQAEISSPSFTICNNYPTCPPVLHCDLYRCPASLPDEVWDALDADAGICIVEWAQYIPEAALPKEFLDIRLESCEKGRFLTVMAHGQASQALAQELHTAWTTSGRHGSRTDLPLFS